MCTSGRRQRVRPSPPRPGHPKYGTHRALGNDDAYLREQLDQTDREMAVLLARWSTAAERMEMA